MNTPPKFPCEGGFSPRPALDGERCTGCGACSLACVTGALAPGPGGRPVFDDSACIGCGHCAAVCPVDAFRVGTAFAQARGTDCLPWLASTRRSVRLFEARDIPPDTVASLLEIAGYSPTGTNAQGLRIVAVGGASRVRSMLYDPLWRLLRILRSTGILRLAGLLSGRTALLERLASGEDLVFRGAPLVLFFMVPRRNPTWRSDGVIAAALVMLRAHEMGLGSFWNGVAEALHPLAGRWRLPGARGFRLAAVLCVGYPAVRYRPLPPRAWTLVDLMRQASKADRRPEAGPETPGGREE